MKKNLAVILGLYILGGAGVVYGAALRTEQQPVGELPWGRLVTLTDELIKQAGLGNLAAVEALVGQGADVNMGNDTPGINALSAALMNHHDDVAQFLMEHGATLADSLGLAFNFPDKNFEFIRLLLTKGAQPNPSTIMRAMNRLATARLFIDDFKISVSPAVLTRVLFLLLQVRNREYRKADFSLAKYLISKGADFTKKFFEVLTPLEANDKQNGTLLIWATQLDDEDFVRLLLESYKNLQKRIFTSLLAGAKLVPAAEQEERGGPMPPDVVFMVLKPIMGADFINAKDDTGHTALWYARHGSHPNPNIEKMLVDAGATE